VDLTPTFTSPSGSSERTLSWLRLAPDTNYGNSFISKRDIPLAKRIYGLRNVTEKEQAGVYGCIVVFVRATAS